MPTENNYEYQPPEIRAPVSEIEMQNGLAYYQEHKKQLAVAAAVTSNNANSWRDKPFKVGCALLTIGENTPEGEYVVFNAYNFKPEPGDVKGWKKRCAERNAVQDALERKTRAIISITTSSTETHTGDPTKAHDALHPCLECRQMFRDLLKNGVLKNESIICNANHTDPKNIVMEERTVGELLELYKDD
ncbi:MAG: hypothetical protein HY918_00625 [Candidatus Doudnabacteria bacterium]|nr:hypothetical protein [Candidatus Doudnabacteria bacterium]